MSKADKPTSIYHTLQNAKSKSSDMAAQSTEEDDADFATEEENAASPKVLEFPDHEALANRLNEIETQFNQTVLALDDCKRQLVQAHADMANTRKRAEEDIKKANKFGQERLINSLLPILDSLESGLNIEIGQNEFAQRVHQGLEMTYKLFIDTLAKFQVKPANPLHENFNPELHQAISAQEQPGMAPNTVIQVLQKGYLLNDRLIRPALVIVTK